MGNCIYCGKSAGWLAKSHKDCMMKNLQGKEQVVNEINNYFNSSYYKGIDKNVKTIAGNPFIDSNALKFLVLQGYDNAVNAFLNEGVITDEVIKKLDEFSELFDIDPSEVNVKTRNNIVKSIVLRDVMMGDIKESRIKINDNPFIFEKDEFALFGFDDAALYEVKTRTQFRGGSQGVGVRLTKGVYYRVGAFKGEPIKTEEMKNTATGMMILTNKHLYFTSFTKNLKIKYSSIIAVPTFEDAIGIQQSRANSKPLYFKNIDVWFLYNLISNLITQTTD